MSTRQHLLLILTITFSGQVRPDVINPYDIFPLPDSISELNPIASTFASMAALTGCQIHLYHQTDLSLKALIDDVASALNAVSESVSVINMDWAIKAGFANIDNNT